VGAEPNRRYHRAVEQLWVARYAFHWRTLLSFKQRRDRLASWVDDNLVPRAILDQEDVLGVAIGQQELRCTIEKHGFQVSLGAPGLAISKMEEFFGGIFDIMKPCNLHIYAGRTLITSELETDYDETRRRFARRCSGELESTFDLQDASAAIDISLPGSQLHAEFGVASKQELRDRLRMPPRGRTAVDLPALARPKIEPPEVAVLCDSTWTVSRGHKFSNNEDAGASWEYTVAAIDTVNTDNYALTRALTRNLREGGGRDELHRGA
jgi:hypothetical protein